ncbi:MAG: hypothetical protein ABH828_04685 [archaeon]
MEKYVKDAVKSLLNSDKLKTTITLKNKDDYKKNPVRILYNKMILNAQKLIVPSHIKNFLLRTTGMKVGHDACIPHYITIDPYFPELVNFGKGIILGGDSTIITHELKGKKLTLGKVIIADRTLVGGMTTLRPGFKLSKNAMMMFFSSYDREIPEGELWAGMPAKLLKVLTAEEIDKYHRPSNGKYKEYYREFRKRVDEFLKDPNQTYFKMHYNGKRLNAGNDWWKARNVFTIWYHGILIELTTMLPHSFFKTFLLRRAGVKIGKNCRIGKGVVFDHLFGDNITLEDNVVLDDHVYLDGHEYTITQTVFGKTLVKKGVHIKKNSYVRIGTTIGENTIIEKGGMAQRFIPPNEVWGGNPIAFIRKRK